MDSFSTLYTYLTINCWYLMKYTIHTGLLGIQSFFNESLSIFFYSCDRYGYVSPLNNRINFNIVNCVQHIL